MNLATSCWECNRGKSGSPLAEVMTGEDPHDRALMLLERGRQLREYNAVLKQIRHEKEQDLEYLVAYWSEVAGGYTTKRDESYLLNQLDIFPAETIRQAMYIAAVNQKTSGFRYVSAVLNNLRNEAMS